MCVRISYKRISNKDNKKILSINNLCYLILQIVNNTELNGKKALTEALKLEAKVTRSIREIIKTCENEPSFNDYHVSVVCK